MAKQYSTKEVEEALAAAKSEIPDLTEREAAALLKTMIDRGSVKLDTNPLFPGASKASNEEWAQSTISSLFNTPEPTVEKNPSAFIHPYGIGAGHMKPSRVPSAAAMDLLSMTDRVAGSTLATVTGKDSFAKGSSFSERMKDEEASVYKPVMTKIQESSLPGPIKIAAQAAVGAIGGFVTGMVPGLVKGAAKAPIKAIKGANVAAGKVASDISESAKKNIPTQVSSREVGDRVSTLATDIVKPKAPVDLKTSPDMMFTAGERDVMAAAPGAERRLVDEAAVAANPITQAGDEAASMPFKSREESLAKSRSRFQAPLFGKSGSGVGVDVDNSVEASVKKMTSEYKKAFDAAESAANSNANTKSIVDELVSKLDGSGSYRVDASGNPTKLGETTSTTMKTNKVVLTQNGKPIVVQPHAKKYGSIANEQSVSEKISDGKPMESSGSKTTEEAWVGTKNPHKAPQYEATTTSQTTRQTNKGYSLSQDISEDVASSLASIRNKVARGGNYSAVKHALEEAFKLRVRLAKRTGTVGGTDDRDAVKMLIDEISDAKKRILESSGVSGDWAAQIAKQRSANDMSLLREAFKTSDFEPGSSKIGEKVWDAIISGKTEKSNGAEQLVLESIANAEKSGILPVGTIKSVESSIVKDIIEKSTVPNSSGGGSIIDAGKLDKALTSIPPHVYDIAVGEEAKNDLLRLLYDAMAHEQATSATGSALRGTKGTSTIAKAAHSGRYFFLAAQSPVGSQAAAGAIALMDLLKSVRGRTTSQIMRRYAGDTGAGNVKDQISDAVKYMLNYASAYPGETAKSFAKESVTTAPRQAAKYYAPASSLSAGSKEREDAGP